MNSICLDNDSLLGGALPSWEPNWEARPGDLARSYGTQNYLIGQTEPKWRAYVVGKLSEIGRLHKNWDGYGAREIYHSRIRSMLDLLESVMREETPAPWVIPVADGNIQVEWHFDNFELEIESVDSSSFLVSFEDLEDGFEEEFHVSTDLSRLFQILDRLTERTSDVSQD